MAQLKVILYCDKLYAHSASSEGLCHACQQKNEVSCVVKLAQMHTTERSRSQSTGMPEVGFQCAPHTPRFPAQLDAEPSPLKWLCCAQSACKEGHANMLLTDVCCSHRSWQRRSVHAACATTDQGHGLQCRWGSTGPQQLVYLPEHA